MRLAKLSPGSFQLSSQLSRQVGHTTVAGGLLDTQPRPAPALAHYRPQGARHLVDRQLAAGNQRGTLLLLPDDTAAHEHGATQTQVGLQPRPAQVPLVAGWTHHLQGIRTGRDTLVALSGDVCWTWDVAMGAASVQGSLPCQAARDGRTRRCWNENRRAGLE